LLCGRGMTSIFVVLHDPQRHAGLFREILTFGNGTFHRGRRWRR
jgi:hypothetical protein